MPGTKIPFSNRRFLYSPFSLLTDLSRLEHELEKYLGASSTVPLWHSDNSLTNQGPLSEDKRSCELRRWHGEGLVFMDFEFAYSKQRLNDISSVGH